VRRHMRRPSWSVWPAGGACPARKLVVIWDNAPCHIAKVVTAHSDELGDRVGSSYLAISPDHHPIERLCDRDS